MLQREEIILIGYIIAVLLIIAVFVITFFYVFQRRKNKLIIERIEQKRRFEQEIANVQIEIQEETLKNVSWELHDNIGQLLSVANIQLNMLSLMEDLNIKTEINEAKNIVSSALQEVRSLSRSLNRDIIKREGLVQSIEVELERIKRLKFADTQLEVMGEEKPIKKEDSIIIFRIIQEFLSNSLKHSKAKCIFTKICFEYEHLYIKVQDNGVGFNMETTTNTSGLINMSSRAQFIKAEYNLKSAESEGTSIELKYNYS